MSATTPRPTRAPLSTGAAVRLVAEREILANVRSKSFLISTALLLVIVFAGVLFGGFQANKSADPEPVTVAATTEVTGTLDALQDLTVTVVPDADAARALVADGTVEAAVLANADGTTTVVAKTEAPSSLVNQLTVTPEVTILEPEEDSGFLGYIVSIAFALVFFMSAMTFGGAIAQSVVVEKQTRVVEILISTISVRALLAGKVIGNTILAFGQIAVIVALSIVALVLTGQDELLSVIGAPMIWFAVFFLFGFTLLAAMFASFASLVSRQEDLQSAISPVTYILMIPYMLTIFFYSNEAVMTAMSYVPFSAPIAMPLRLFLGTAQWWEPILALVILIVSVLIVLVVGSKIYRNSLLHTGARRSVLAALRG